MPRLPLLPWIVTLAVASAVHGQIRFEDGSGRSGLDFVHFNGMTGELHFSEMMGSGAALLDYDGDGDLDVLLVQGDMLDPERPVADALAPPASPPGVDRLYRNDAAPAADGTAVTLVDVTEASGLGATRGYGMGVAVGDVDGDGWLDLYVTNLGPNFLWRNRGDGTFEEVGAAAGVDDRRWGVAAAFVDYDRDGDQDLYVGNYVDFRLATHKTCRAPTGVEDYCGPLAYEPEPDELFRNRGDGTFEAVTGAAGLAGRPAGALGVGVGDFDADGWPDLYVANDQVPNQLWINRGDGTFVDEALLSGTGVNAEGQPEASMGVIVGDLDADGDDDIFLSHLTRETNTLYVNDGGGLFEDSSRDSGLGMPSWEATGFGVAVADFDLDGVLDVFVANGAVKLMEEQAAAGEAYPLRQRNQLFRGVAAGRWEEATAAAGEPLAEVEVSRGVARGDVDLDGDDDLILSNSAGPARWLRNVGERRGGWLAVDGCRQVGEARTSGTRIEVTAGDGTSVRRLARDGSYASANERSVVFGVPAGGLVTIAATRPDGGRSEWRGVPASRRVALCPERP